MDANGYVKPPVFTPNTVGLSEDTCPGPGSNGQSNPSCFMGTWVLQTAPFNLPSGAAYADVWFSVTIGFENKAAQNGNPPAFEWNDPTNAAAWGLGTNWVNYWQP